MTTLRGACHCGNLRLELEAGVPAADLPARACSCSFCRARRARWTSAPTGGVVLTVADASSLSRYRFGTRTADFLLCRRCGVHIAAVSEIDGALYAVVNVDCIAALRDIAPADDTVSFDGEGVDDRLARRKRSWTPARWAR